MRLSCDLCKDLCFLALIFAGVTSVRIGQPQNGTSTGSIVGNVTQGSKVVPAAKVTVASAKHAVATKASKKPKMSGGIFHMLLAEWEKVPDKATFLKDCEGILNKLLPELHREYTARNVPTVLYHECDIYATKTDFMTNNTSMEDAHSSCRFNAHRLGVEFLGNKDYAGWCEGVHQYLDQQSKLHVERAQNKEALSDIEALRAELEELRKKYADLQREKHLIAGELDKLGGGIEGEAQCCPKGCRPC